ncbi:MAG: outer membrane beta-barrel protein [Pseudomonadota bacterium]
MAKNRPLLFASVSVLALSTCFWQTQAQAQNQTDGASNRLFSGEMVRDWTGFYGGAVVSGGLYHGSGPAYFEDQNFSATDSDEAFAAGLTVGYNRQHGHFVWGFEADVSWGDLNFDPRFIDYNDEDDIMLSEWQTLITLRGRAGIAVDRTFAYFTGGAAIAQVDQWYCYEETCGSGGRYDGYYDFHNSGWHLGIAAGLGVEHAVNDKVTVKAEYLYVGLPGNDVDSEFSASDSDVSPANFFSSSHLFRLGVNYTPQAGQQQASLFTTDAGAGPVMDWNGAYAGLVGGTGNYFGSTPGYYYTPDYYDFFASSWGGALGVTVGANRQVGALVYGIEGDLSWTNFNYGSRNTWDDPENYESTSEWDALATVRARAGVALDNTLVYVTGGVALAHVDQWWCYDFGECGAGTYDGYYDFHNSGWKVGFAAGFGVEHAIRQNVTIKADYLFAGLPTDRVPSEYLADNDYWPGTFESSVHMLRGGINIKFGEGGPVSGGRAWAHGPDSYDWAGFYGGAVVGGGLYTGSSIGSYYSDYYQVALSEWGATGGLTVGANIQRGSVVAGVEADFSWSGLGYEPHTTYYDPSYYETRSDWNYLATIRGRVGLAVDNSLIYATGGLAFADVNHQWCYDGAGECGTDVYDFASLGWKTGFAAGAGVEHAIRDNFTIKAEYLYVGLPSQLDHNENYPASGGYNPGSFESSAHMFRLGANVKVSDRRLKRDIRCVGQLLNGLALYAYRYLWSDALYVGVMAQEVLEFDPEAVVTRPDGYFAVDYARLGTRMMTYEEFLRSHEPGVVRTLAA